MPINTSTIERKIFDIEKAISKCQFNYISLLGGSTGVSLFYYSLFELTKNDKYLQRCHDFITQAIDNHYQLYPSYTISNGYAGLAWILDFYQKRGILDIDDGFFSEIQEYMFKSALTDLTNGNYDYLHGGMSPVIFALNRLPDPIAVNYLTSTVEALSKIKISDDSGTRWEDKVSEFKRDNFEGPMFNLGLSHGMTSIINMLLRINKAGICTAETSLLAQDSLNWLMKCKIEGATKRGIYPTCIFSTPQRNNGAGRLAWCYGDLGIAWTLLKAGEILNSNLFREEAVQLIQFSTERQDALLDPNFDAGFCHGSSGIAYMLKKFHAETNIPSCVDAHNFWLLQTLKMANSSDGVAGYKMYNPIHEIKWTKDFGLLQGIAGVGLVLIDHLSGFNSWDECLLLNMP